ncbi:murein biosynthesis integral membrane protein MurJ [Georgenia sp. Z1344]|uniref:murein biosynthesis integral membrane protein MurJ n=1 Tax=Georgenia sp. Z1344 TaxID=3416706 RepID=UPI003CF04DDF
MNGRRGLAGSSVTMFAGTLVSRVLGLVKGPVLLVAVLGANTGASNAFDVANRLPNLIYLLVAGGVLNAVLVPQIVRAMTKDEDGGDDYVSRLLTAITLGLAGLTVVLTLAAPLLVRLFAFGMEDPWYSLSVTFAYWCIPQLFFYGMYTLLGQVLNARGIFGPYTWAPVLNNVVAIIGLVVFLGLHGSVADLTAEGAQAWTQDRTILLAGVATAGVAAQALVLLWPLRSAGVRLRPRFGFRGRGLGSATSTAMWVFAALLVGQLATLAISNVAAAASAAGDYAIDVAGNAAYTNSYFLYSLPTSLVVVSLITALFTRMSTSAAHQDLGAVRADLSLGLRVVGLFTVFCSGGLMVLALPLVRVITPAAAFAEVESIAMVLVAMLLGLVGVGAFTVIQRVYYAFEDARRLFFLQLPLTAVVVVGAFASLLLPPRWVLVGACVAMAVSNVFGAALSFLGLRPRLGHTDGGRVVRAHVRITIAAAGPVLLGWGLLTLLGTDEADLDLPGAFLRVVLVGVLMVLGYFVALRTLHVDELEVVARPLGNMVAGIARRLPGPLRTGVMWVAAVLNPGLRGGRAGGPAGGTGAGEPGAGVSGPGAPGAGGPGAGAAEADVLDHRMRGAGTGSGSTWGPDPRSDDERPLWARSAADASRQADDAVDASRDLPWAPHIESAWEPVWNPGRRRRPEAADQGPETPGAGAPDVGGPGTGTPGAVAPGTGYGSAAPRDAVPGAGAPVGGSSSSGTSSPTDRPRTRPDEMSSRPTPSAPAATSAATGASPTMPRRERADRRERPGRHVPPSPTEAELDPLTHLDALDGAPDETVVRPVRPAGEHSQGRTPHDPRRARRARPTDGDGSGRGHGGAGSGGHAGGPGSPTPPPPPPADPEPERGPDEPPSRRSDPPSR